FPSHGLQPHQGRAPGDASHPVGITASAGGIAPRVAGNRAPRRPAAARPGSVIIRRRCMFLKPGAWRALRTVAASVAVVLVASTGLLAAPQRGRLSEDLSSALARGGVDRFDVIVQGGQAAIDDVAARHGAVVKKRLRTGAVLQVSRDALEAMSADSTIAHLSGDAPVQSMMAVTAVAVG